MILSCTNIMVPGNTLTEKAHRLRGWGYKGVTVFADYASWNDEKLEELLTLEDNTGVVPCEFLFISPAAGKLMSENADERAATKALYIKAADVCAKIGAITEIEYMLGPQDPLPLFDVYKQMTQEQEDQFLAVYREIAATVAGTKAAVLLEGINRYESPFMNSIVDCARVAAKLDMDGVGVLPDFFHMSIEEADIAEAISAVAGSIRHVHLGDNNRCTPGQGSIDWERGLKALKATGYNKFLSLECSTMGNPDATIPEAADYLNKILARI
ncbi:sugar phosphate isomerase/epimerase family protein [Pararhizobium arenae]|uniref:sugar phosphate isomerase/epimerase family protein n=1 Tax=Pararhizobium arenae TaxID=1856850 RepID=UPI00094B559D|nr:sugar phosphate isomerase/epimerase [Pararhizobium arenae]